MVLFYNADICENYISSVIDNWSISTNYWRDFTEGGKTEGTVRRKCLSATLFATNSTWTSMWLNPVLMGEKSMALWDMVRPKPSFLAFLGSAPLNFNCLLDGLLLQSQFKTKFIVTESSAENANTSLCIISTVTCAKASFRQSRGYMFLYQVLRGI